MRPVTSWKRTGNSRPENSTDGYHVATVHRNFATTVGYRETLAPDGGGEMVKTEASRILSLDKIGSGGYDVGNGHMINGRIVGTGSRPVMASAREALRNIRKEK